jgi:hypothetical protein
MDFTVHLDVQQTPKKDDGLRYSSSSRRKKKGRTAGNADLLPFYPATTSPDSSPVTALRTRAEQRNVDGVAEASEKEVDRSTLLEIFMEMLSRYFPVEKFWATIISVPAGWKQG